MKKLSILLKLTLLILTFIISSCSKQDDLNLKNSTTPKSFISLSKAKDIASKLNFSKGKNKIIETITPVKSNKNITSFYVVNYKNGGFVLLAADNKSEPILAYSEKNNFLIEDQKSLYPKGLGFWIKNTKNNISKLQNSDIKQSKEQKNSWKPNEIQNKIFNKQLTLAKGITKKITKVGPLTTTEWSQTNGFNNSLDNIKCGDTYKKVAAGCVPIAVAQFMKYFKYPKYSKYPTTYYKWDLMLDNESTIYTQDLIKDIHNNLKLKPNSINYKCDETYTKYSDIKEVLRLKFRYRDIYQHSYDSEYLIKQLKVNNIVLLSGNDINNHKIGHMWICDGYEKINDTTYNLHN
ncbi:C10 family peptidase [Tenacibaculum pacificus]|uniref:C10 family peptidase n=1 Tax=Tenacibaculum pacificus TaxID=3018314 RepID=UPI0022F3FAFA|nr:C10 family peptidase [Tenacibaculum pacificus]WBX73305.1 C10 family peptidase [Tenacibaculum pacificus]